jgi:dienelactone hydrolase
MVNSSVEERAVSVSLGEVTLEGDLAMPGAARGLVLFAHGSGSSRHSPRNRFVAGMFQEAGLATLLLDLLTADEGRRDAVGHLRFNIELLAERVVGATSWLKGQSDTASLPIGYFGASTGAAAALVAAAALPDTIGAVVSRGGRPDLAGSALTRVWVPTLLIVGGNDQTVLELNGEALRLLGAADKQLIVVLGATHLFEEPGTLEEVARLAADWLVRHLDPATVPRR